MTKECGSVRPFIIMAMDWVRVTDFPIGTALAVDDNTALEQARLRWPENTILQAIPWEEIQERERLVAIENDREIW